MSQIFCPRCGRPGEPGTSFCAVCGTALPVLAPVQPVIPGQPPAPPAYGQAAPTGYAPPQLPPQQFPQHPVPGPATPRRRGPGRLIAAVVLVIALAAGAAAVYFLVLDKDDKKPASAEQQAEAAVDTALRGYDRVASHDESGCALIVDNTVVPRNEPNFLTKCQDETSKAGADLPTKITSIKFTKTELDAAAGTGNITVEVTTKVDGKSRTSSATVPVRKVDGRWKLDPSG